MTHYIMVFFLIVFSMVNVFASEDMSEGVYSSLEKDDDVGDYHGKRLIIINSNKGYYGVYQCGSGELSEPEVVQVSVSGDAVSFRISDAFRYFCYYGEFRGELYDGGIRGSFSYDGEKHDVNLKRRSEVGWGSKK